MSESTEFGLVMPFIDQSESFTLGFEAGRFCTMVEAGNMPEHMLAHTLNTEQLMLIAQRFDCDLFIDPSADPAWCQVTFSPKPKTALKLVLPDAA